MRKLRVSLFILAYLALCWVPIWIGKLIDADPWLECFLILLWSWEVMPHVSNRFIKWEFGEKDE